MVGLRLIVEPIDYSISSRETIRSKFITSCKWCWVILLLVPRFVIFLHLFFSFSCLVFIVGPWNIVRFARNVPVCYQDVQTTIVWRQIKRTAYAFKRRSSTTFFCTLSHISVSLFKVLVQPPSYLNLFVNNSVCLHEQLRGRRQWHTVQQDNFCDWICC